jgi:hypothetical protein
MLCAQHCQQLLVLWERQKLQFCNNAPARLCKVSANALACELGLLGSTFSLCTMQPAQVPVTAVQDALALRDSMPRDVQAASVVSKR